MISRACWSPENEITLPTVNAIISLFQTRKILCPSQKRCDVKGVTKIFFNENMQMGILVTKKP